MGTALLVCSGGATERVLVSSANLRRKATVSSRSFSNSVGISRASESSSMFVVICTFQNRFKGYNLQGQKADDDSIHWLWRSTFAMVSPCTTVIHSPGNWEEGIGTSRLPSI